MNNSGHDPLDAMASEFIAEIKDDLASLEPMLLSMEKKGVHVDDDLINQAFRSIHSIKGGAGFIDFKALMHLSHAMENVLMGVREKKLVITSEVVDALLSGFDKMKLMVEMMGAETACGYEEEEAALLKILKPDAVEPSLQDPPAAQRPPARAMPKETAGEKKGESFQVLKPLGDSPVFQDKTFFVEKSRLDHALNSQKFVYAVHIRFENDLVARQKSEASIIDDIRSVGDILFSDIDDTQLTEAKGFFCVISTILDLPLLSQVLEISKTQMTLVDRQFTDYETILKGLASSPGTPVQKEKPPLVKKEPIRFEKAGPPEPAEPRLNMPAAGQTLRINVDLISRLMNRAGELVLSRNRLRPFLETYALEDRRAASIMQDLDMVTSDIQESIMQMRMQPVIDLLGKYKRVVRDIARRISKRVDLILEGSDVEVDRNVLEKLANPVTHLIRNCIDHGIELPEERRKRSKPETGTIWIRTSHQGGQVHLEISDDGRGIDPQLILSKAFEKGLVTEDQLEALTDKQKINLIFLPGFSTAEQITDISGRGVGMDVVKTNIGRLRGQIEIDSVKGEGTRVHLIIPLTLAIVPSLIVSVGEFKFAIPQVSIKEIIFLEPGQMHQQVEKLAGSEVLRLRGRLLPILRLRNVLGIKTFILEPGSGKKAEEKRKAIADRRGEPMEKDFSGHRRLKKDRRKTHWDTTHVVILKLGPHIFGLCVDELFDIHEVVVEPLSEYLRHLGCFAGTTILGDGDVIMVLDVPGIADYSTLKLDAIKQEELKRNQLQKQNADPNAEKRSLLVFCNTRKEYFALELHSVARLEPLQPKDIHFTGDLKYMKYQEQAVQLFSMDEFLQAGRVSLDEPEFYAIFPKNLTSRVGIMVSNIIDTIETRDKIDRDDACPDFVRGKIFIEDMMVQVLDHEKFTDLIEQKRDVQKTLFKEVNENTDR